MPLATVTTDGSVPVISAASRRVLILQNNSDTDIDFGFEPVVIDDPASAGIRLKAGGASIALTDLPATRTANNVPIYAAHAGTGQKMLTWISI